MMPAYGRRRGGGQQGQFAERLQRPGVTPKQTAAQMGWAQSKQDPYASSTQYNPPPAKRGDAGNSVLSGPTQPPTSGYGQWPQPQNPFAGPFQPPSPWGGQQPFAGGNPFTFGGQWPQFGGVLPGWPGSTPQGQGYDTRPESQGGMGPEGPYPRFDPRPRSQGGHGPELPPPPPPTPVAAQRDPASQEAAARHQQTQQDNRARLEQQRQFLESTRRDMYRLMNKRDTLKYGSKERDALSAQIDAMQEQLTAAGGPRWF